jgi:hypothetical protein
MTATREQRLREMIWDDPDVEKAARTITISSGGKRRDDSLNPIVARVKRQLIKLVADHSNRPVQKEYTEELHPRDDHGQWTQGAGGMPDHAAIAEAANNWAIVSDGIRSGIVDGRPDTNGKVLLDALANSPANAPSLYRGMGFWPRDVDGDAAAVDKLTNLNPGDHFDLNLASWSSDRSVATDFGWGILYSDPANGVPMLLEVNKGAQALSISSLLQGGVAQDFASQKEWLTGGGFKVISVTPYAAPEYPQMQPGYRIRLEQETTLANDPIAQASL